MFFFTYLTGCTWIDRIKKMSKCHVSAGDRNGEYRLMRRSYKHIHTHVYHIYRLIDHISKIEDVRLPKETYREKIYREEVKEEMV